MAQRERRQVPEVRRPRGVAWRSLQADGLIWEGQVFLVGADFDLAARLIVTRERLALVRGGGIILEAARDWLRPAPRLLPDGNVLLSITPPGETGSLGKPETLLLRMREGWGDASHIVTLLGGSRSRRRGGRQAGVETAAGAAAVVPASLDHPLERERPTARATRSDAEPVEPAAPETRPDPPWSRSRRERAPIDVPVRSPAAAGAASTHQQQDPYVLPPPQAPAAQGRHYDWNLPPAEVVPSRDSRRRRGWIFRLVGVVALIATAVVVAALATTRDTDDVTLEGARITESAGIGGVVGAEVSTATPRLSPTPSPTPTTGTGAADASLPTPENEETAVALGVGSDLSPTATTAPVQALPTLPTEAVATATPTVETPVSRDDEPTAVVATVTATAAPLTETSTPPPSATPVPTDTPTVTATAVPSATAPAPAAIATATPAELPATATVPAATATATAATAAATATAVPPTSTSTLPPTPSAEPTQPPPTATAVPPTSTPEPTPPPTLPPTAEPSIPTQVASVAEAGYTAPAFEEGALRLTVESTMKGSALPSLGLAANPYGEWLVAVVYVYNWTDAPANLIMQNFGLITADPAVSFMPLDSGTSLVGGALGFELPLGSSDVAVFMPGEGHRIGLLFTADPFGSGFSLQYGSAVIGLQDSLVSSPDATALAAPPADPNLLEAIVTDVVDGDTIMVEIDGVEAAVTYVGVRAPAPGACYGPEATAANAAIVTAGDTVYLEREATNETAEGALLRDVWIDLDGASVLVANELAAAGAVDVLPDSANDRFTSWLQVTVANAAFQGLGLWGACGGEVGDVSTGAAAAVPRGSFALLPRPPALGGGR